MRTALAIWLLAAVTACAAPRWICNDGGEIDGFTARAVSEIRRVEHNSIPDGNLVLTDAYKWQWPTEKTGTAVDPMTGETNDVYSAVALYHLVYDKGTVRASTEDERAAIDAARAAAALAAKQAAANPETWSSAQAAAEKNRFNWIVSLCAKTGLKPPSWEEWQTGILTNMTTSASVGVGP